MSIKTPSQFGRALGQPYAWPGGYPTYFVTSDCAALCHDCAKREGKQITWALRTNQTQSGWHILGLDVNYDDPSLYCDDCGERIESAYAEDEAQAIKSGDRDS